MKKRLFAERPLAPLAVRSARCAHALHMPALASPSLGRRSTRRSRVLAALAALAVAGGCGGGDGGSSSAAGTCEVQPPCPLPQAIVVRVFPAGASGPVPDATVTVRAQSGTQDLGTVGCTPAADASVCRIAAGPGIYDLSIGAPGFETAVARAEVTATTASSATCCPTVNAVTVDVPLTTAPP